MLIILFLLPLLILYFLRKNILFSPLLIIITLIVIYNLFALKEKFIQCKGDNHIMEPTESEDYIDTSIRESMLLNIGSKGTKYPFDSRYIPKTDRKWCLKSVLN